MENKEGRQANDHVGIEGEGKNREEREGNDREEDGEGAEIGVNKVADHDQNTTEDHGIKMGMATTEGGRTTTIIRPTNNEDSDSVWSNCRVLSEFEEHFREATTKTTWGLRKIKEGGKKMKFLVSDFVGKVDGSGKNMQKTFRKNYASLFHL